MAVSAATSAGQLQPLARTKQTSVNNEVSGGARIALDILLPISTGVVADQLLKSSLKSGKVQAIALSFVGAAAVHAVTEAGVQVVKNKIDGLPWDNRLGIRALRGAQGGLFIAAGNLIGPAIQGSVAKRFNRMHPVLLVGVSNAVAAVSCGAVRMSADPDTWQHGFKDGVKRIATTQGINALTAVAAGSGIKGLALIPPVGRVFAKLPYPFSG